jgi:hypothetical protein
MSTAAPSTTVTNSLSPPVSSNNAVADCTGLAPTEEILKTVYITDPTEYQVVRATVDVTKVWELA